MENKGYKDEPDKALRQLFDNFRPDMDSDIHFIKSLDERLGEVEDIKKRNRVYILHNKQAAIWAAVAGFVAGIISTLLMPYLIGFVNSLIIKVDFISSDYLSEFTLLACYAIISLVSILVTIGVYNSLVSVVFNPESTSRKHS